MEALASLNLAAAPAEAANADVRAAGSGSEQGGDFNKVFQGALGGDAGDVSTNSAAGPTIAGKPQSGNAEQGEVLNRSISSKRWALGAGGQPDEPQSAGDAAQTSTAVAALASVVPLWLFLPAAQLQAASAGAGGSPSDAVERAADAPGTMAARAAGGPPDAGIVSQRIGADVDARVGGKSLADAESVATLDLPKNETAGAIGSSALVDGKPEQNSAVRAAARSRVSEVTVSVSGNDAAPKSAPAPAGQTTATADVANQMPSIVKQVQELQADSPVAAPVAQGQAAVSVSVDKSGSRSARAVQSQDEDARERLRFFALTHDVKAAAIERKQPEAAGKVVPAAPPAANVAPVDPQQAGLESDGSDEDGQASSEKKGLFSESAAKGVVATIVTGAGADSANPSQTQGTIAADASSARPALAIGQANHEVSAGDNSAPETPPHAATSPATWHLPDAEAGRFVNAAQLADSGGHSEMRIALQTDKLGNVELHARIAGDGVGAAITVERRDAHAALAVELPALQQALAAKQLRVDEVALLQGSLSATTGDARQGGQQQMSPSVRMQGPAWGIGTRAYAAGSPESASTSIFDSQGRLNVRA